FAMRVAVAIRYDLNTKNKLVLKAADVVESQRIEWDKNLKEIPVVGASGQNRFRFAERNDAHFF
ncbi:hypothetical protein KU620_24295, partial [Salmonella enterica subsp. enterica serovar Mbandaka]|nr:hypothetical protein [Salmonella enterica subsp. enterica serovar Mbandaka]